MAGMKDLDLETSVELSKTVTDDGTVTVVVPHPHGKHTVAVEHDKARIAVYLHHPEDGSPAYLVVDIDSEGDEPDLRVYVNDAPVAGLGSGELA